MSEVGFVTETECTNKIGYLGKIGGVRKHKGIRKQGQGCKKGCKVTRKKVTLQEWRHSHERAQGHEKGCIGARKSKGTRE